LRQSFREIIDGAAATFNIYSSRYAKNPSVLRRDGPIVGQIVLRDGHDVVPEHLRATLQQRPYGPLMCRRFVFEYEWFAWNDYRAQMFRFGTGIIAKVDVYGPVLDLAQMLQAPVMHRIRPPAYFALQRFHHREHVAPANRFVSFDVGKFGLQALHNEQRAVEAISIAGSDAMRVRADGVRRERRSVLHDRLEMKSRPSERYAAPVEAASALRPRVIRVPAFSAIEPASPVCFKARAQFHVNHSLRSCQTY
jgi:hypothetical protein